MVPGTGKESSDCVTGPGVEAPRFRMPAVFLSSLELCGVRNRKIVGARFRILFCICRILWQDTLDRYLWFRLIRQRICCGSSTMP